MYSGSRSAPKDRRRACPRNAVAALTAALALTLSTGALFPAGAQERAPGETWTETVTRTVPIIATDEPDRICQEAISRGIADPTKGFAYSALSSMADVVVVEVSDRGCEFRETSEAGWYHVDRVAEVTLHNRGSIAVQTAKARADMARRVIAELLPDFESLARLILSAGGGNGAAFVRGLPPADFARRLQDAINTALEVQDALAGSQGRATAEFAASVDRLMGDLDRSLREIGYTGDQPVSSFVADLEVEVREAGARAERTAVREPLRREGRRVDIEHDFWSGGGEARAIYAGNPTRRSGQSSGATVATARTRAGGEAAEEADFDADAARKELAILRVDVANLTCWIPVWKRTLQTARDKSPRAMNEIQYDGCKQRSGFFMTNQQLRNNIRKFEPMLRELRAKERELEAKLGLPGTNP